MLVRKWKSFIRLPFGVKLLFAEAIVISAYVKFALLFLPFKKVASWLGGVSKGADAPMPSGAEYAIKRIRAAMKLCDRYTPWRTECYTQSLTAKLMLKRRNISSILYFGFARDENGKLKGHAWLQSSTITVTGAGDLSQYQIHSSFS